MSARRSYKAAVIRCDSRLYHVIFVLPLVVRHRLKVKDVGFPFTLMMILITKLTRPPPWVCSTL